MLTYGGSESEEGRAGEFETKYLVLLDEVLKEGARVRIGPSLSVASEQVTIEVLNRALTLDEPRDRLLAHPLRSLNIFSAVGRFVWMMSGSNRLSEIEFYEPRARIFSDDGLTVPGSCEGTRLFYARPGLNQIAHIIELLKSERNTRRAAAVTYFPEDAGRISRDIPCTISLIYNVRDGRLHATTVMRANDALRVLPYDLFSFSMLAEFVAVCAGTAFGSYHHLAVSMHIYERDEPQASALVAAGPQSAGTVMAPMPSTTTWDDIHRLVHFEAEIRQNRRHVSTQWQANVQRVLQEFDDYWRDFALVVILHALRKYGEVEADYESAVNVISDYLGTAVRGLVRWDQT